MIDNPRCVLLSWDDDKPNNRCLIDNYAYRSIWSIHIEMIWDVGLINVNSSRIGNRISISSSANQAQSVQITRCAPCLIGGG